MAKSFDESRNYLLSGRAASDISRRLETVDKLTGGTRFPKQWKGERPGGRRGSSHGFYMFRAAITGHNPTSRAHAWKRLANAGTISDDIVFDDDPRVVGSSAIAGIQGTTTKWSAYDPLGKLWPTGAIVWIRGFKEGNDLQVFEIVSGAYPGAHFAVKLTKTGGSDGTKTTAPSYVYTATSIESGIPAVYGASLSPVKARRNGKHASGDGLYGVGFYTDLGDFVLWDANEQESPLGCPE